MAVGTLVGVALAGGLKYRQHHAQAVEASDGVSCENGIGAAKIWAGSAATTARPAAPNPAATQTAWNPKINIGRAPGPAPAGMTWIPGGQFWMGTAEDQMADTRPWHRVYVDGYWMDQTEVTNEQFAKFVKATGYVTVAISRTG